MLAKVSGDRGCGIERKLPGPGSMVFSSQLQLLVDSESISILEGEQRLRGMPAAPWWCWCVDTGWSHVQQQKPRFGGFGPHLTTRVRFARYSPV